LRALAEDPPVLVVDNGSSDDTARSIDEAGPGVRGILLARNAGAAGREARLDPVCREMMHSRLSSAPDLPGPRILGFLACGAVARRAAFLDAGGFHPRFEVGGEERLLAIDLARRGWGLAYCAEVVAHHHPDSDGERPQRRARMLRNDLWTAWLRCSAGEAILATVTALRAAAHDPAVRAGLAAALAGLPWALRERRVVGMALNAELSRLLAASRRGRGTPPQGPPL
jgi:N-acetylglucosaminyl-diphospho-decaprenol L-rhamnosyltransferase